MKILQADQVLGKLLRLPKTLIPRNKSVRILRGPLRGRHWLTGAGPEGWWLGLSEQDKLKFVSDIIRPGGVFYDIGANVGLYSMLAAEKIGATGRVISFEPASRNCSFFRKHMEMNQVLNVDLLQIAIGDKDGEASFDDDGDPVGFRVAAAGKSRVQMRSLDSMVSTNELPPPSYLKIDVEGAELQVLQGASSIIKTHRPDIFIETHNRFVPGVHEDCSNWLRQHGYHVREFGSDNPKTEIFATASKTNNSATV